MTVMEVEGRRPGGHRLFLGGVKEFADGSLGARTALMWQPYDDDTANSGSRMIEAGELSALVRAADAAGLQVSGSQPSASIICRPLH